MASRKMDQLRMTTFYEIDLAETIYTQTPRRQVEAEQKKEIKRKTRISELLKDFIDRRPEGINEG